MELIASTMIVAGAISSIFGFGTALTGSKEGFLGGVIGMVLGILGYALLSAGS